MQKEDETFVQKLQMRKIGFKKDLLVDPQLRIVFSELQAQTLNLRTI